MRRGKKKRRSRRKKLVAPAKTDDFSDRSFQGRRSRGQRLVAPANTDDLSDRTLRTYSRTLSSLVKSRVLLNSLERHCAVLGRDRILTWPQRPAFVGAHGRFTAGRCPRVSPAPHGMSASAWVLWAASLWRNRPSRTTGGNAPEEQPQWMGLRGPGPPLGTPKPPQPPGLRGGGWCSGESEGESSMPRWAIGGSGLPSTATARSSGRPPVTYFSRASGRGWPTPAYDSYLVDSASSHMLVSKIKPCMSKYKQLYGETANGSLYKLSFI